MTIKYENTFDDIIVFNKFHYENSPSVKRSTYLLQLFLPVSYFVIWLVDGLLDKFSFKYLIIFFIISILWVFFIPILNKWYHIRNSIKMYSEGDNKIFIGQRILTISPNGIIVKSDNGESKINWNLVNKIVESNDHLYIYVSSVSAYIIPKKIFKDEIDQNNFMKTLKEFHSHS